MSYIHEALIKAQKERHSNFPNNQVQVAETVGFRAKSSWLTLTLLLMLISILVAIIMYSWFKSIQKEQLNRLERDNQTKFIGVNPEQSIIKSKSEKEIKKAEPVVQSENKQQIIKKKSEITENNSQKIIQTTMKQPEIRKTETQQIDNRKKTDEIISNTIVEKKPDDDSLQIIGPTQFLEVSRLYDKGLQYQVQKKYETAKTYYQKCLKISPHMAPALNNMGVILLNQKEFNQAKSYFLTAIKESPDYVDPYYNLACLFSQKKNSNQAIKYLKMAVQISPDARNWAITDRDFEPLFELKEFNMIISGY